MDLNQISAVDVAKVALLLPQTDEERTTLEREKRLSPMLVLDARIRRALRFLLDCENGIEALRAECQEQDVSPWHLFFEEELFSDYEFPFTELRKAPGGKGPATRLKVYQAGYSLARACAKDTWAEREPNQDGSPELAEATPDWIPDKDIVESARKNRTWPLNGGVALSLLLGTHDKMRRHKMLNERGWDAEKIGSIESKTLTAEQFFEQAKEVLSLKEMPALSAKPKRKHPKDKTTQKFISKTPPNRGEDGKFKKRHR